MSVLSTHINISSNTKLLDLDDDALELIFEKCSLRELIILMKTCIRLRIIILKLPRYENGIKELKELYDTDILIKPRNNNKFIKKIYKKNYSSFVLEAIDFRFQCITSFNYDFDRRNFITNTFLSFISRWCKNLNILILSRCKGVTDVSCLGQCKMLTRLILNRCTGVTDISCLSQCKILTQLALFYCTGVTNVSCLGQCKMLFMIVLQGCTGVTDVSCLDQCELLVELNLEGCTSLTQKNVDSLREKIPGCRIDYYY